MVQTTCFLNSQIHFSLTPHNPNLQALGGVCSSATSGKKRYFYMKTQRLNNMLDLDSVELHWFSFYIKDK